MRSLLAEKFLLIVVSAGLPCLPAARGQASAPAGEPRTPRGASGDSTPTEEPRCVLDCIPGDAAAVFFADSPQRFVGNPLFASVLPCAGALPRIRAALTPVIDGPVALALLPEAGPPARFVPIVAAKLRAGAEDPMKRLWEALPKAINGSALAQAAGACTAALNDDGSLTLKFERYPDVFVARRGDVVLAATDATIVAAFQAGREMEHSLADRPEVVCGFRPVEGTGAPDAPSNRPKSDESRRADPDENRRADAGENRRADPDNNRRTNPEENRRADSAENRPSAAAPLAACYVNLNQLEKGYGTAMPIWAGGVSPLFRSDDLDGFALVEHANRFRVAFIRGRAPGIIAHVTNAPTSDRTMAGFFPADDVFLLSATLPAMTGWEQLMRAVPFIESIRPGEEGARTFFRVISGIDLPEGMLPFPDGRWAFGGAIDRDGHIAGGLLAVALKDAAGFQRNLDEYRRKPGSKLITNTVDGVTIDHWRTESGRLYSTMVQDDVLLIADEPHTLVAVLESRESHRSLETVRFFPKLAERLPHEHALLASVELETLFRSMPMPWHSKLDPAWRRLARNHPSIMLAAVPIEGGACFELVSAPSSKTGWSDAWEVAAIEYERVRAQARRQKSAYQLQDLATAMLIYAGDHDGAGPPTIQALLDGGNVQSAMLGCPYPELATKAVDEGPFYVLRNLPSLASLRERRESSTTVMAGERMIHDGGANFAFVDGHVEWVESPRAEELLRQLTGGE